ncbi:MAG: hypothetical protein ACYTFY_09460 [Planctomycetota bacterium]|jgi:hypothetical protein
MSFDFKENGSVAKICYQGNPIIRMMENYSPFGGTFSVQNQKMVQDGHPEVAFMPLFATLGYHHAVTEVSYEVDKSDTGISVRVIPENTKSGKDVFELVREVCTLSVELEGDRFVWRQHLTVTFLKDIELDKCDAKSKVRVYSFPMVDGSVGRFLQFADPMPVNASGPAVPMARDWIDFPEPTVGADTFRSHWKRDYVKIIYQNTDNSFSWTELNRQKTHAMQKDNQCARECHPKGKMYLVKADGEALEYSFNSPSHYHHICEWGMDFHCWLDVEEFTEDGIISAGTAVKAETVVKMVDADITEKVLKNAKHIELTEKEKMHYDLPAYEEPENSFAISALERADAIAWKPTSEGCSWSKTGGYKKGYGCLAIENSFSDIGSWELPLFGPSHWANPFVPGARYRLSAWVRCSELEGPFGGPGIGIIFNNYLGPASSKKREEISGGWSEPLKGCKKGFSRELDWAYLEVITIPCPSYVLSSKITLKLEGMGKAYFSNVGWEIAE